MSADQPVAAAGTVRIGSLRVRRIGFGALHLSGPNFWGPPADPDTAITALRRAVELGVDLVDTADSYGPQVSEELVRQALHPYRGVTVATKAGLLRPDPAEPRDWPPCGRPQYLRQQCELSLRRLGVDTIDLFHLHRIDPTVPAEDQFGLLAQLRAEGKVREVGLSEVTVAQLQAACEIVPVAAVQNLYNLADRRWDGVLAHCQAQGIAFTAWYPLDSGRLASPGPGVLREVATAAGVAPAQVALAWLLRRSPALIAIPGTASVAEVEQNCAAAGVELPTQLWQRLDQVTAPSPVALL